MSRKLDFLLVLAVPVLWLLYKLGVVSDEFVSEFMEGDPPSHIPTEDFGPLQRSDNTGESGDAYDAEMEASKNAL